MKTLALSLFLLFTFQINLACTSEKSSFKASHDQTTRGAPTSDPQPPPPGQQNENTLDLDKSSIPTGRQVMPTQDGRVMVYDFQPGSKPSVWLLIHGLADDMTMLNDLSRLASEDGHSVLRIDLQGHGETLKEYLRNQPELPEKLDYFDNIVDLQLILKNLNIKEITIVGHSYGGGIAYGLATELKKEGKVRVQSLHMLAPYVQRIDKFLRESSPSSGFFPTFPSGGNMDSIMDPILDKFMESTYRAYFMETLHGSSLASLTPEQKKEIDIKVKTAILATKGIRAFDLLDEAQPLPEIDSPLQVIGGQKDLLVLPKQLKAFEKRLKNEKRPVLLEFLNGPSSTHLFPRIEAEATYKMILNFQNNLPLSQP